MLLFAAEVWCGLEPRQDRVIYVDRTVGSGFVRFWCSLCPNVTKLLACSGIYKRSSRLGCLFQFCSGSLPIAFLQRDLLISETLFRSRCWTQFRSAIIEGQVSWSNREPSEMPTTHNSWYCIAPLLGKLTRARCSAQPQLSPHSDAHQTALPESQHPSPRHLHKHKWTAVVVYQHNACPRGEICRFPSHTGPSQIHND